MKNKNLFNILRLIVIYIILNIILLPYILNKKYHFIGTMLPYFFDADSFYYLNNMTLTTAYVLAFLLPILTICLFYWICSKGFKTKYPFLATLGLITFPYFFNQLYISNIDMQKFVSLIFVFIFGGILLFKDNGFKNYFKGTLFIVIGSILVHVWSGSPVIYACLLFGLIFGLTKGILRIFLLLTESAMGLYFFKDRFLDIVRLKAYTVIEYATPKYFLYYLMFIFIVTWFMIYYKNKDYGSKIYFGSMLFMFMFSLLVGRLSVLAIILMFFMLIKMEVLNYKYVRIALISMIVINVGYMMIAYHNVIPNIDRSEEVMFKTCFDKDYPIMSYWYNGHIIDYFTDNDVIFKATPIPLRESWFNSAILSGDPSYFDRVYNGKYYLYFKEIDAKKVPDIYTYDLISKVLTIGILEGFETVCYDGNKIVLLREGEQW